MQAVVSAEPAPRSAGVQKHQSGVFAKTRGPELEHGRHHGREEKESPWITCGPQDSGRKTLQKYLLEAEPALRDLASNHDDVSFFVVSGDKSRQSAINKLANENGGGDASLEANFDILAKAVDMAGFIGPEQVRRAWRLNDVSDEGGGFKGGRGLPSDIRRHFNNAVREARMQTDLSQYRYTLISPFGGNEAFEHNLYLFSKALRNPEMCISSRFTVSNLMHVSPTEQPGFIMDALKRLGDRDKEFSRRMPETFRRVQRGIGEVQTPFPTSLTKLEIGEMDYGVYVEIKLAVDERDARALLPFTANGPGWQGTRKGFTEIFSSHFGMRGLNTFLGETRTNSILTPIAHAMDDLINEGALVVPVNGGYLRYWVGMQDNDYAEQAIRNAIIERIRGKGGLGPGYADLPGFTPSIETIDAPGFDIKNVRAMFILKSLGMGHLPPDSLDKSDFILNFIENIHPIVQGMVFGRLATGAGGRLNEADRRNIEAVRTICLARRTIRDTEDFIWVLRKDNSLPPDIRARKKEIESWLMEFSVEKAERVFHLLAEEISRFANRK